MPMYQSQLGDALRSYYQNPQAQPAYSSSSNGDPYSFENFAKQIHQPSAVAAISQARPAMSQQQQPQQPKANSGGFSAYLSQMNAENPYTGDSESDRSNMVNRTLGFRNSGY